MDRGGRQSISAVQHGCSWGRTGSATRCHATARHSVAIPMLSAPAPAHPPSSVPAPAQMQACSIRGGGELGSSPSCSSPQSFQKITRTQIFAVGGRGGGRHPRKPLTRHAPSTTHLHCLFTRPKIDPSFASSEFSGLLQQFSSAHPGLGSGRESREEVTGSSSRPRTPCETPLRPCSRAAKYSSTWPRDLARCDSLENPRVIPEEMTRLPLS